MSKKRKLLLLASLFCIFCIGTGIALAYQTDHDNQLNTIRPGWNDTSIVEKFPTPEPAEPGSEETYTKEVAIKNSNSVPCYVRVLVKTANQDVDVTYYYDGKEGMNTEDWVYNSEDDFYYYKSVLNPGETTKNLMDEIKVSIPENMYTEKLEEETVIIYEESVQSKNADTGENWPTYKEAWQHYTDMIQ